MRRRFLELINQPAMMIAPCIHLPTLSGLSLALGLSVTSPYIFVPPSLSHKRGLSIYRSGEWPEIEWPSDVNFQTWLRLLALLVYSTIYIRLARWNTESYIFFSQTPNHLSRAVRFFLLHIYGTIQRGTFIHFHSSSLPD